MFAVVEAVVAVVVVVVVLNNIHFIVAYSLTATALKINHFFTLVSSFLLPLLAGAEVSFLAPPRPLSTEDME